MKSTSRAMINLNIDLLRTFVTVSDLHTFAEAANHVFLTQSAVSQQMKRLEELVDKPLFITQGRNKVLTTHGTQMLRYAKKMLQLNDDACLSLKNGDTDSVLRIGSPDDTANTILPYLLSRFSKSHPRLRIEIIVKRSPFLMEMLDNGEIDMAISTIINVDMPYITLRTSSSHWYCAINYVVETAHPLPLVVMDEPSIFRNMAINHLDQIGIPWRIAYVATTLSGARAAAKAGLGIIARSLELLGDDLRIIGEGEGLPRLPDIKFNLYMKKGNNHPIAKALFDSLLRDNVSKDL